MVADLEHAQRYVGKPYVAGVFDCADLAVMVQWELFGRVVVLPTHRKRPAGARGQAREIAALRDVIASRIDMPVTGCGVLLYEPDGSEQGSPVLWHIGTVFIANGVAWVLHNSEAMGSAALQRLEDLGRWGMRLDGFYAWRTRP